MRRTIFLSLLLSAGLLSAGCFIDPNKLLDGGLDANGGDGSNSGDDQSVNTDGGQVLLDSGSTVVSKTGSVVVAQYTSVATSSSTTSPLAVASAGFYSSVPTPCGITTVGACQVQKCANTAPTADQAAGVISITGGTPSPLTLTPSGPAYSPIMQNSLLWSAPSTLSVSAAGNGVPAFAGSVSAPAAITVTAPAKPDLDMLGPPMSVSAGSDLALAWNGGSAGTNVEFMVASLPGDYIVRCSFPAQNGTGTVPSAVLTQMLSDGVDSVRVGASSVGATMITAGEYKVNFLAINTADYNVTLELE